MITGSQNVNKESKGGSWLSRSYIPVQADGQKIG